MDLCAQLRETLAALPNLLRLNLSINKVRFQFSAVLWCRSVMRRQSCRLLFQINGLLSQLFPPELKLTHLALDTCRLLSSDFRFLASALFYRGRVRHLDLSGVRPTSADLPLALEALFAVPWPALKLLRLTACRLDSATCVTLSQSLVSHDDAIRDVRLQPRCEDLMEEEECLDDENRNCLLRPGLAFLDLSETASRLNSVTLLQCLRSIFRIRSLRCLKAEYPQDCYFDGAIDFEKKVFFDTQVALIRDQCKTDVTLIFSRGVGPFD